MKSLNPTPALAVPKLKVIPTPKPMKVPTPKIAKVSVSKFPSGGFKVQHVMTHGLQPEPFVFQDPQKMMSHLARIQKSEWREPDRNEGAAVEKQLNVDF